MTAAGMRMHELLMEVVATANVWQQVSDVLTELGRANLPGIDPDALAFAEAQAYESLILAISNYTEEGRAFEDIQRALDGDPWKTC